jgi:hypothetical protein
MFRTDEIAVALTTAWVRNGVTNKEPKEIADFYRAVYDALEQVQGNNISKAKESQGKISTADSRYKVVQVACWGILTLFAAIGTWLAMFVK